MRNWSLVCGSAGKKKRICGEQPIIHRMKKATAALEWLHATGKFKRGVRKPKELTIVTMHNYPEKPLFERSLAYLHIHDYTVLPPPEGPWKNINKIFAMRDFINNGGCKTDYLLFCDARDCAIIDDPYKIIEIFDSFNCKLLFGATMSTVGCYGYREGEIVAPPKLGSILRCWANRTGVHRRYLNSGVYIGKPLFIKEFLDYSTRYIGNRITNDQGLFRALQPMFEPYLKIDYSNELVYRN